MSNPFSFDIQSNSSDSHQSTPWCLMLVLPFLNPQQDGLTEDDAMKTEDLFIDKDILKIQTQSSKSDYQTVATANLISAKYNYQSKVNPGDHAFIWMGDDRAKLVQLQLDLAAGKKCNGKDSGLKFFGRVISVRTDFVTQGQGIKTVRYNMTMAGFSEFGATIYYNPLLYNSSTQGLPTTGKSRKFLDDVSAKFRSLIFGDKGIDYLTSQGFVEFFINVFLGEGPDKRFVNGAPKNTNTAFLIPSRVAEIFGVNSPRPTYSDIIHRLLGIQQYDGTSYYPVLKDSDKKLTFLSKDRVVGSMLAPPETFDSTIWALIDNYKNPTLNECYTTLKINKDGDIAPHFTLRQIPFNTDKYTGTKHTKLSTLPTWKLATDWQIYSFNIGTSDASRFNFFQVFGHYLAYDKADPNLSQDFEKHYATILGNFDIYGSDIRRSGPRNMIRAVYTNFIKAKNEPNVNEWTLLLADWYKNGHLKFNGTIDMAGVSAPICVGDNLQVANKSFHIESVSHSYTQEENGGIRTFSTSVALSRGIVIDSSLDSKEVKDVSNQFTPGLSNGNE
jgi:hypothetical protein